MSGVIYLAEENYEGTGTQLEGSMMTDNSTIGMGGATYV